jgi:nucleoside-triphosphatase
MKKRLKKMKRLLFLTGPPRSGKTTVLFKVAERLATKDYKLGGMVSQEIRKKGVRVGFEIRDYASSRKGWLAHVHQPVGPRVGKYRVNLDDLN